MICSAWNTIGLAIRFAYGNALHLRSEAPSLHKWKGELRIRVWYSLCYIESILCMSTGRPPGISPRFFSTPVPHDFRLDINASDDLYDLSLPDLYAQASLELFNITEGMLRKLYSAQSTLSRRPSFNDTRTYVGGLLQSLDNWKSNLPGILELDRTLDPNDHADHQRLDLALRYYHLRMLTTRACLCKFDPHGEPHEEINTFDDEAANICVAAASSIAQIITDLVRSAGDTGPFEHGPWWCVYHHVTSAASVLLLEMAYGLPHAPKQGQQLFDAVQNIIVWLCSLATSNPLHVAAQRCYSELSQVLAHVAPKIGYTYKPPQDPNYTSAGFGLPTTPGRMDMDLTPLDIPSMIENPQLLEFYFPLAPQ